MDFDGIAFTDDTRWRVWWRISVRERIGRGLFLVPLWFLASSALRLLTDSVNGAVHLNTGQQGICVVFLVGSISLGGVIMFVPQATTGRNRALRAAPAIREQLVDAIGVYSDVARTVRNLDDADAAAELMKAAAILRDLTELSTLAAGDGSAVDNDDPDAAAFRAHIAAAHTEQLERGHQAFTAAVRQVRTALTSRVTD